MGARARQSVGQPGRRGLEAPGETIDDGAFLGGTLFEEAEKARLVAVLGHDLVKVHAVSRGGFDALRGLGVELPDAFTADHQVPVAVLMQQLHALLGGDFAVHHHQRLAGSVQRLEHVGHRVGPMMYRGSPSTIVGTNVTGTCNMLELARIHGIRRFVFCSSIGVYGNAPGGPGDEDHPLNPTSVYGATKVPGEQLVRAYGAEFGIEGVCLPIAGGIASSNR